ncbi:hypothetical protein GCM10027203_72070 [Nonomuraea fastidiosa]
MQHVHHQHGGRDDRHRPRVAGRQRQRQQDRGDAVLLAEREAHPVAEGQAPGDEQAADDGLRRERRAAEHQRHGRLDPGDQQRAHREGGQVEGAGQRPVEQPAQRGAEEQPDEGHAEDKELRGGERQQRDEHQQRDGSDQAGPRPPEACQAAGRRHGRQDRRGEEQVDPQVRQVVAVAVAGTAQHEGRQVYGQQRGDRVVEGGPGQQQRPGARRHAGPADQRADRQRVDLGDRQRQQDDGGFAEEQPHDARDQRRLQQHAHGDREHDRPDVTGDRLLVDAVHAAVQAEAEQGRHTVEEDRMPGMAARSEGGEGPAGQCHADSLRQPVGGGVVQ